MHISKSLEQVAVVRSLASRMNILMCNCALEIYEFVLACGARYFAVDTAKMDSDELVALQS